MDQLSNAEARRLALAAQGFDRGHPSAVSARTLSSAVDRLQVLQLDSVNVFARSHYLPLFARLGSYDMTALDRQVFSRGGRYVEYWAHEAALIRRDDWPLWHWKREALREKYQSRDGWVSKNPDMMRWLLDELAANGPMTVSDVEHDAAVRRGPWWGWSDVKLGLESLFAFGDVVSAGRRGFSRVYALPEHAGLADLDEAAIPRADAERELVRRSVKALGVGTVADIADYHRLKIAPTQVALRSLVDEGSIVPVTVDGWMRGSRPDVAYRWAGARVPRRIDTTALLSPFDPVVWFRPRNERLFDFHYRIEIYTPAPKRQFGYYSLPVLIDEQLAGRIDLKSDRQARVLRVQSAWAEEGVEPGSMAERVAPVLARAAQWQGLNGVVVADWGNAIEAIRASVAREG